MNNQNNINSLYQLIKKTSQEKRRPLKIIADWDDVIQAQKPFSFYIIENPSTPFKE